MSDEHLLLGAKKDPPAEDPTGETVLSMPRCGFCKTELSRFSEKRVIFEHLGYLVHMFWCPNKDCSALQCMQILGPVPPKAPPIFQPPPGFRLPPEGH